MDGFAVSTGEASWFSLRYVTLRQDITGLFRSKVLPLRGPVQRTRRLHVDIIICRRCLNITENDLNDSSNEHEETVYTI